VVPFRGRVFFGVFRGVCVFLAFSIFGVVFFLEVEVWFGFGGGLGGGLGGSYWGALGPGLPTAGKSCGPILPFLQVGYIFHEKKLKSRRKGRERGREAL